MVRKVNGFVALEKNKEIPAHTIQSKASVCYDFPLLAIPSKQKKPKYISCGNIILI